MEWPNANSSGPHGPIVSPSDYVILESSATPICFPQATEEINDDDECGDILSAHMRIACRRGASWNLYDFVYENTCL